MSHRGQHASSAGTSSAEARDWRAQAACWGEDPELFFPIDYGRSAQQKAAETEAKRICALCPSIVTCLEAALAEDDRHAIRGGLTPNERARQFGEQAPRCADCSAPFSRRDANGRVAPNMKHCPACRPVRGQKRKKEVAA